MEGFILPLLTLVAVAAILIILYLLGRLMILGHRLKALSGKARKIAGPQIAGNERPPKSHAGEIDKALDQLAAQLQALADGLSIEKEKIAAILFTIGAGVLILDKERRVTMLNEAAARLFGVSGDATLAQPFISLIRDHEMDAIVQQCLATGQNQTGVVSVAGGKQFLELRATPLSNGVLVLVSDLTRMRRLEKVRQDFIANVSHELRTPIASLKAMVETLHDGAIEDGYTAQDFLQRMHVEVDKLAQMVSELGELSRIESGEQPLKPGTVDLAGVINRVVERLRTQADRAQLSLILDIPPDLPEITADESRLEQVLVNLVHNAIKFTPPQGKITISAGLKDNNVLVSVADTGIGIPGDDLGRIFERFYKVDKARSGGGTGLGLAIAKHIVQAHGGDIGVASTEGKGATFTFTIPVAVPDTEKTFRGQS